MIAACNDGHGGESLYENLKNAKTPRELLDRIAKVPRNETIQTNGKCKFWRVF